MKRQMILGMGAGQCGLQLLAKILDKQPRCRVTLEQPPLLPWVIEPGAPRVRERLERILRTRTEQFVGDVATFYLPYVDDTLHAGSGLVFGGCKRTSCGTGAECR
ncbi:MAG: hypothetical protein EA424_28410 [Planctomycetaceae bacterium]|nr:MAG: hypothetical protein EA424_28410 [Planctomycetaceae bacterium]